MRLSPLAIGPVLAGCALVAVTSCSTDEPQTEAGLAPSLTPAVTAVSAYDIVKATTINVDGFRGDWTGIDSIMIADDPNNGRGALNNSATVKLAWNDTYLFAMYDVSDTDLRAVQTARDAAGLYQDDEVELYIDPQGDGATASSMTATDYHFLASILEVLGDKRGTGTPSQDSTYNAAGFLAQAITYGSVNGGGTDTRYVVETRIPWTDLGVTPAAGNFMRVDLAVGDRDGTAPTDQYFDWANLGNNFNRPSGWKDVQLVVDATAPAAPTNPTLSVVSSSQIDVSWTASSSSDVSRYRIFRGTTGTPALVAQVYDWPYQDTGLAAGTTYTYQIAAVDPGGNQSAKTAPVSASTNSDQAYGVPFGPFDLFSASGSFRQVAPFSLTLDWTDPAGIISQINLARDNGVRFVPQMTGGSHSNYTTNGQFDFGKWKTKMNTFNTTAIKTAMAAAVSDGTVIFAELMDEPNSADWGGMTHAMLDSMSRHAKTIFPTLRTGVTVQWDWQSTAVYQSLDVLNSQYGFHQDTIVERYRDSAVVSAKRQNVALMFSMNLLHGGAKTFGTPMTASQVENFGKVLVSEPFACALTMWTWDDTFMAKPENQTAFNRIAATAAGRPAKACAK
jgi:hypothetical protein